MSSSLMAVLLIREPRRFSIKYYSFQWS